MGLLLDRYHKKEEKIRQAEEAGRQSEDGNSLENYDAEMDSAAQKSQEAEAASKSETGSGAEDIFGSGEESGGNAGGNEIVEAPKPPAVTNPIPIIKQIRKMGLLDLVVPADQGISENQISLSNLVSHRQLQEGINLPAENIQTSSATSQILYQQYLMEHLGNYREPSTAGLKYQIEYLLGGKSSDRENLQTVARRLLLIREGINVSALMTDASKRAQIQALALAVASGFLIPPAAVVIETALISVLVICGEHCGSAGTVSWRKSTACENSGRLAAVTGKSSESPAGRWTVSAKTWRAACHMKIIFRYFFYPLHVRRNLSGEWI